jgi:RHS repeat-associated protein
MTRTRVVRIAILTFALFLAAALGFEAAAQFELPKRLPRIPIEKIPGLDRIPGLDKLLGKETPITTSIPDILSDVPFLDSYNPAMPMAAGRAQRTSDGQFVLRPGAWTYSAQSYCLKAGTHAPGRGSGYAYAPLKGPKANVVRSVLRRSIEHPEVSQQDIQVLLWAIIARAKLSDMPPRYQLTAAKLLTPKELFELNGGALGLLPDSMKAKLLAGLPPALKTIIEAENRLRQMMSQVNTSFDEIERVAVLLGDPPATPGDRNDLPSGRWSYHPDGYFIRFAPSGYSRTQVDIVVPKPYTIVRDESDRIILISDQQSGRSIDISYQPGSARGTEALQAYKFSRVRFVDERAGMPLKILSEWNNTGGTLLGVPDSRDSAVDGQGAELDDVSDRLTNAWRRQAEVEQFLTSIPKLRGSKQGQKISSQALVRDLADLAHLYEGLSPLAARSKTDPRVAGPLQLVQEAWQFVLHRGVSEPPELRASLWHQDPGRPGDGSGDGSVNFDPAGNVGVPGEAGRQRIGQSGRCAEDEDCEGGEDDASSCCGVDGPCEFEGSLVDVHNQALGERIRISGTPFALYYRSDRIRGGQPISFPNSLAGWSLDVHHAYDAAGKILYTGEGRRRRVAVAAAQPGGEIHIPSEDGTVVEVFDDKGRQLRTMNSLPAAVRYQFVYDRAGLLVGVEDAYRNTTRIERDARGIPTGIVAPGGQRTVLTTFPEGQLKSVTNPAGEAIRLSYSKDGRLTELTDPKDQVHRFTYSSQGALLKDENPAGGHWTLARTQTPNGFKVALSSALGRTSSYEIERLSSGQERRVNTGPGGAAIRVEKDGNGNDKVIDPDGTVSVSEFQPDPRWGDLAPFLKSFSVLTPGGRALQVSAERKANAAPPPKSARAKPVEPSFRSLTSSFTVNGRTYQSNYDVKKMEWTQTSPAGRQVITSLNAQGRVVSRVVPGMLPTSFVYDASGRLSGFSQGTGAASRAVTVSYDAAGRIARIVDPLERATQFEYDPAGRVTKQIFADGRQILYAYDPNGNLTSVTPPLRPAHQFEYTRADRVGSYLAPAVPPGRTQTAYVYNQDKQLTRVTRPDAKTIDIEYDKAGRISALAIPQGKIRYLFDPKTDHLKTITAADGGTLSYQYDGFLPTRVTCSGVIQGDVARAYDNELRVSSVIINGKQPAEYRYDPDGLLIQAGALILERHPRSGGITATKLGNVTTVHGYDDFGQIKRYAARFKDQEVFALEYERDAAGRIIKKIETVEGQSRTFLYLYDLAGRLSEVTSDGTRVAVYEYDANGNRTAYRGRDKELKATYDAQDRLATYDGATYRYTANGELARKESGGDTAAFDYDALGNLRSAALTGGPKLEYVIDGANRRIGRKLDGKLVQGFLYTDRLKPVAELDGRNQVVSTFVYAAKVNVPEYVRKADGTYRIITDHLGSPRLVIHVETGTIVQKMDYDEFGNVLQDTNPGFQPFGFAGGLYDLHTRLTRFGARDYDASVGRWTAKDPVRFARAETNLYAYAGGDPANKMDPLGLHFVEDGSDAGVVEFPSTTIVITTSGQPNLNMDPDSQFQNEIFTPRGDDFNIWDYIRTPGGEVFDPRRPLRNPTGIDLFGDRFRGVVIPRWRQPACEPGIQNPHDPDAPGSAIGIGIEF